MITTQTPAAVQEGEATLPAAGHHLELAADLLTRGGTERDRVRAVARAIADAEQRGRDDVRFGSAWCPDCGAHCDSPHQPRCPWAATPPPLERHR